MTRTQQVLEQISAQWAAEYAATGPGIWREPIKRDTRTAQEIQLDIIRLMDRLNAENFPQEQAAE